MVDQIDGEKTKPNRFTRPRDRGGRRKIERVKGQAAK